LTAPTPRSGQAAATLQTPALAIDLDALERNVRRMAEFARQKKVRLRPHAKTHKSAALARLQIDAGAVGVCVQKVSEADALAGRGVPDLYITNEVIDEAKLERVAALAGHVRLAIAVDSALGVQRLAAALRAAGTMCQVFVEVDVGQGRCGVAPVAAGALAHQVVSAGLRFGGLQAYQGRAQHLRTPAEREAAIRQAVRFARAAQASVSSAGLVCPLVTGAGTGTFTLETDSGVYGELQVGSYVFMDRDYADNEAAAGAPVFEHALFVKAQVTSRGFSHAVVDAGHKSHALDSGLPSVWQRPLDYANGGDEHGILKPAAGASADDLPALGESIWLVPGHCDPTVNLHDHYVVIRGGLEHGVVHAVWPVDARGCVQ